MADTIDLTADSEYDSDETVYDILPGLWEPEYPEQPEATNVKDEIVQNPLFMYLADEAASSERYAEQQTNLYLDAKIELEVAERRFQRSVARNNEAEVRLRQSEEELRRARDQIEYWHRMYSDEVNLREATDFVIDSFFEECYEADAVQMLQYIQSAESEFLCDLSHLYPESLDQ